MVVEIPSTFETSGTPVSAARIKGARDAAGLFVAVAETYLAYTSAEILSPAPTGMEITDPIFAPVDLLAFVILYRWYRHLFYQKCDL